MTTEQKINRMQTLLGAEVTSSTATEYLSVAEDAIIRTRYPFSVPEDYVLDPQFHGIQCELAARYYARMGGLGEIEHNENGINRVWESPDDKDLLGRITPFAKVV